MPFKIVGVTVPAGVILIRKGIAAVFQLGGRVGVGILPLAKHRLDVKRKARRDGVLPFAAYYAPVVRPIQKGVALGGLRLEAEGSAHGVGGGNLPAVDRDAAQRFVAGHLYLNVGGRARQTQPYGVV